MENFYIRMRMKISDIVFEMQTNYVNDDDIESIVAFIEKNGFDAQKVDDQLVVLGYDPIFSDEELDIGYDTTEKIVNHRKYLGDE